ncbi:MAG TPA: FKBP-type peptidyl-prolyl cis-trans isomerase [Bacteroidales bacterium]|nr:FKBP-type peptidyl-prolyl cis-trans isomerase [Bacteroidales bacterium]HRR92475.1 FKBP-type peptidyl-prolyl cis-trans isomerase [Bacteroidales bacterium]HRT89911.1 FKBP-type peptidyl-prolyl cis-trans isomerase [Bacteroidales bacterium]
MKKTILIISALIAVSISSCDLSGKYEREETQIIQNYLSSIGDTVYVKKPSGLYFLSITEGTGESPADGDTVAFWYTAKLLSGGIFDTNRGLDSPFSFVVGSGLIITGLDEGIRYMKNGGVAKIITPSNLAYGSAGLYGYDQYGYYRQILPGYTPLVWDIEIASIKPGPEK